MLNFPTVTYFDMYLKQMGFEGKFHGVSGIKKECQINSTESCTEKELEEMYRLRDEFNWDQPDFFMPKIESFKEQIFGALPAEGKLMLTPVLMLLNEEYMDKPENMQTYWQTLLSAKPQWLTDDLITQAIQLAKNYNIPLEKENRNVK